MPDDAHDSEPRKPGIFESARRLATTFVEAAQTRLDLASTEIEEERGRLERYVLLSIAALFSLSLGLLLLTAFIVVAVGKSHVLLALGLFTLLYLGLGAWAGLALRHLVKERPRFLEATRAELKRDRERLSHRHK